MANIEKKIHSLLLFVVFITSSIMVSGVIIQVILRSYFDISLTWMEELSRYMFIWSAFIGAAIASRDKLHPTMDLILKSMPETIRKYIHYLIKVSILTLLCFITYAGFKLVFSPSVLNQESVHLRIPMYVMYSVIPISSLLMLAYEIVGFKELITKTKSEKF